MFLDFLFHIRSQGLAVGTTEWLCLCQALEAGHIQESMTKFYYIARSICCKTESDYDSYDLAFSSFFGDSMPTPEIRDEFAQWLETAKPPRDLSAEEKKRLQSLSLDELRENFLKRLQEQKERHDGGNKWIGTGGTSPFGHSGYHPSGLRVGGDSSLRQAMQVASERRFRELRKDVILDTRQLGVALKKLREWGQGERADELDLEGSIDATARNAGDIEIVMQAPRRNAAKLLLMMDIGGSMSYYSSLCEKLFSAVIKINHFKEFRHLYFHNCPYEHLYSNSSLTDPVATLEVLREFDPSWYLVVVGDAAMSPYELTAIGGSVDYFHHNEEPGIAWLQKLRKRFPKSVWINPEPNQYWQRPSNQIIRRVFPDMFPLSIDGLDQAISHLKKRAQKLAM